MGLVTDAQRTEVDDAAFEYRVRAKGMQAKRDIILKIWRSLHEKGLRVMATLVGDTPQHLAFVAGLTITNKARKSSNCIRQQRRKPLIARNNDVLDLLNNDQRQRGKRDQNSCRQGGLENIRILAMAKDVAPIRITAHTNYESKSHTAYKCILSYPSPSSTGLRLGFFI